MVCSQQVTLVHGEVVQQRSSVDAQYSYRSSSSPLGGDVNYASNVVLSRSMYKGVQDNTRSISSPYRNAEFSENSQGLLPPNPRTSPITPPSLTLSTTPATPRLEYSQAVIGTQSLHTPHRSPALPMASDGRKGSHRGRQSSNTRTHQDNEIVNENRSSQQTLLEQMPVHSEVVQQRSSSRDGHTYSSRSSPGGDVNYAANADSSSTFKEVQENSRSMSSSRRNTELSEKPPGSRLSNSKTPPTAPTPLTSPTAPGPRRPEYHCRLIEAVEALDPVMAASTTRKTAAGARASSSSLPSQSCWSACSVAPANNKK